MMKNIGAISDKPEPPNTLYSWVLLKDLGIISKGDFVIIEDAKRKGLKFIGQIVDIVNYTSILISETARKKLATEGRTPEEYVEGALSKPEFFTVMAKVKHMYQIVDNSISSVGEPPSDGSLVYKAEQSSISTALGLEAPGSQRAICIGKLYSNNAVDVCFNANRMFGGHVAVFGQTWSGKSYAVGVIIEETVSRGIPVVVFDHMGEYLDLDKTPNGSPSGISVIRVGLTKSGQGYIRITLDPRDVVDEPRILHALGITDAQLNLLRDAYNEVKPKSLGELLKVVNTPKGPRPLLYIVGRKYGYSSATIDGLRWKLSSLLSTRIMGQGFNVTDIVKKGRVTVVDLSDVYESSIRTIVVATLLSKIVQARMAGNIPPTVVVLEEAHNYVGIDETPSSILVRDLIRGARHWGVGVILVSQRPAGIHRDAVNIVNTHIIFRLKGTDLDYVKQFTSLTKEEVEEIPLLPEGVAYVTGPIIRGGHAIKVKIRARRTIHGGQTINFI